MFTIPSFFPFITMIEDEGDNGGGDPDVSQESQEPEFDEFGIPFEAPDSQEPEPQEVKPNPAWEAILGYIPEDKRPEVLPKFKEWDDNFAKVQSEYAPYKPLLENKVPFEEVQRAFAFANLVNTNPKALYDELGQRFGFGQGQQQVDNNEEEDNDDPDLNPDPNKVPDFTKHPEFIRMQQTIDQFKQAAEAEAVRQQEQADMQRIESEFSEIENEHKVKLNPQVRAEVINRAVLIGDRTGNYDIREGYKDYVSFVSQVRNSRANATAPKVFSGNGGLPTGNAKSLGELSDEERAKRIVAMLEAAGKEP